MNLLILRHADAASGYPDLQRPLTHKGEEQAKVMAAWLRENAPKNLRMLVSPALRTQQTARAFRTDFETVPEIGPGASADDVLNAAQWPDNPHSVLVVGHQPTMGHIATRLLHGTEEDIDFEKAGLWWFEHLIVNGNIQTVLRLATHPVQLI